MSAAPTLEGVLDAVRPLIEAGASLHWLVPFEKRPIASEWSKAPFQTEAMLRASYRTSANIGLRLGEPSMVDGAYLHLIDLDIRRPELAAAVWSRLLALWPAAKNFPSVISGSGGESRHVYFLSDKPFRKKKLANGDGFEIVLMGTGSQVVIPPSIHPDTRQPYRWERPLELDFAMLMTVSSSLVESWGADTTAAAQPDDDDDLFGVLRAEPMDLTDEQIEDILDHIPNEGDGAHYDDYVQVGMALHHQFRGTNEGFERWCEWAKQSSKFDAKNAAVRWRSFSQDSKNPVRMATLIQIANSNRLARDLDFDLDAPRRQVATTDLSDLLGDPQPAAKAETIGPDPDWPQLLHRNEEGELKTTLHNVTLIAENDLRSFAVAQFNQFKQEKVMRKEPPQASKRRDRSKPVVNLQGPHWELRDPVNGVPLSDTHYNDIRRMIEAPTTQGGYGIKVSDRDLYAAVDSVSRKHTFHPVRERLMSVVWDGRPRVASLFVDYLGCEDDAYHRNAATLFLLGAIARAFQPGHKFDFVPILEGAQGQGKSTFIRILALDWFRELAGDISKPQEAVAMLSGAWILEIGELSAMQRSEVNDLKAFISRQVDIARMPYERTAREFPRQCVFMGSTNDGEYLRDITGGRRFWPIKCRTEGQIDNPRLRREVMQIWAEAMQMYMQMTDGNPTFELPLYMADKEAAAQAAAMQESRRVETVEEMLAGRIQAWLDTPIGIEFDDLDPDSPKLFRNETCVGQIWEEMLGRDGSVPHTEAAKIGKAMLQVGWNRSHGPLTAAEVNKKYGKCRVYTRPDS